MSKPRMPASRISAAAVPKPCVAEALLSLFAARDRAAAIVGDLTEESRARGNVWFYLHLFGTALALCFAGVRSEPLHSFWRATAGLIIWKLLYIGLLAATAAFAILRYFDAADLQGSRAASDSDPPVPATLA